MRVNIFFFTFLYKCAPENLEHNTNSFLFSFVLFFKRNDFISVPSLFNPSNNKLVGAKVIFFYLTADIPLICDFECVLSKWCTLAIDHNHDYFPFIKRGMHVH